MRNLKDYLNEGLLNRKVSMKTPIRYCPKNFIELKLTIIDLLNKGITDLNCIDTSNIVCMDYLFYEINQHIKICDIDISEWNVSKVKSAECMFKNCYNFNANLSNWNVESIENISGMFLNCKKFKSDLSKWNPQNIRIWSSAFDGCDELKRTTKIPMWFINLIIKRV